MREGSVAYLPTILLQTGLGESARQGTHPLHPGREIMWGQRKSEDLLKTEEVLLYNQEEEAT